ncbi:hypothetical protein QJQ58_22110 [Paenibacillus dendritiformis]|uniref:hypothetical protein n=1 Tax=Paenibacillus TaxID=44249 RepID=UPI00105A8AEF|nr:hypothetical protein [Paenibacillus dendritiformis]TDL47823.1 hypothetical protein E2R60_28435 [Paenibacillus dendritiformis]WGU93220.1 hypothetical protein QJQ58_22110 [Paenibacillus dendritiformis]
MNAVKVIIALVVSIVAGGAYAWVTHNWSDIIPIYPLIVAGCLYLLMIWVSKKKSTAILFGVLLSIAAIAANLFTGMALLKHEFKTEMVNAGLLTGTDAEIKDAVNEIVDEYLLEATGYQGIVGYTVSLSIGEFTTKSGNTIADDEPSATGTAFQAVKFGILLLGPVIMGWRRKEEKQEEAAAAPAEDGTAMSDKA